MNNKPLHRAAGAICVAVILIILGSMWSSHVYLEGQSMGRIVTATKIVTATTTVTDYIYSDISDICTKAGGVFHDKYQEEFDEFESSNPPMGYGYGFYIQNPDYEDTCVKGDDVYDWSDDSKSFIGHKTIDLN